MKRHFGSRKLELWFQFFHFLVSRVTTLMNLEQRVEQMLRDKLLDELARSAGRGISKRYPVFPTPRKSFVKVSTPYSIIPTTVPSLQQPHKTAGGRNEMMYSISTGKYIHNIGNSRRKLLATI